MSATATQAAPITDTYSAALRADREHWISVGIYGLLCGIGAAQAEVGLCLLVVFAFVSSLRIFFRNRVMLGIMLLAAALGAVFPPIGVILMLAAVVFLLLRIKFIIEHFQVVQLGFLVYGAAIVAMLTASDVTHAALDWVAVPSLREGSSPQVVAGLVVGTLSGALMHDVLVTAYRRGYSTAKALEIMSMIPLIVLSMVLPLLKLHFDLGLPAEPGLPGGVGLHHGPVDFHGVAPGGGIAPEVVFGQAGGTGGLAHALHGPGSHGVPPVHFDAHAVAHGPTDVIGHAPPPPEPLAAPHLPAPPSVATGWHPPAPALPPLSMPAPVGLHDAPPLATPMFTPQGLITVSKVGSHVDFQPTFGSHAAHASLDHSVGLGDVVTHGGVKTGYFADGPADHSFHAGMSPLAGPQPWQDPGGLHHIPGPSGIDIAQAKLVGGQWHVTDFRPGAHPILPQPGSLSLNEVLIGLGFR